MALVCLTPHWNCCIGHAPQHGFFSQSKLLQQDLAQSLHGRGFNESDVLNSLHGLYTETYSEWEAHCKKHSWLSRITPQSLSSLISGQKNRSVFHMSKFRPNHTHLPSLGAVSILSISVFFCPILWCSESDDHPLENLTKFGYKPDMKVGGNKRFRILLYSWLPTGMYNKILAF
jgi:hypothetical protein